MLDSRHLEMVALTRFWPDSLGTQFFTSLRRHCADAANTDSLDALLSTVTDAAERTVDSPLDREFLSAAARALTLGIIGREHADSVLYDFGDDVIGNTQGSSTLRIKPQAVLNEYRVDFLLTAQVIEDATEGVRS